MTVNHGPIAARQHRDFESELADRCHHAVHRGIVFARISAGTYREAPVTDAFCTREVPEALVVVVTSGTYRIESAKGRRWTSAHYHPGSVGLTAPGNSSMLRWRATGTAPLESVQIRLGAALVQEAMQSLSVPSSTFPDVLQLDDSYVAATGKVIASAVYRRARSAER